MTLTRYNIRANLLCHDVRLNTTIETEVLLDHYPTESEAMQLLWPAADERVARDLCEGCPYELSAISIQPGKPGSEIVQRP